MDVRSRKSATKWTLFFHYVSILVAITTGILLVPLYLKFIPLEMYGAWLATGNILAWLTIVDPGLSMVLQQRISAAYGQDDHQQVGEYLMGGLCVTIVLSLVVLVAGLIVSYYLPDWLNLAPSIDERQLSSAFVVGTVGTALTVFSYAISATNQGLLGSIGVGLAYSISNIISICIIVIALYNGYGVVAIALGMLVRGIGYVIGNLWYLLWRISTEGLRVSFTLTKTPEVLRLVSYTFQWRATGVLANNLDLFIVARYLGADVVPMLALTKKVPEICRMVLERPSASFMSSVANLVGSGAMGKAQLQLTRLIRLIIWALGLLVAGVIVYNDNFVQLWVGEEFYAGTSINVVLCASVFVIVFTTTLGNLCFSLGNIKGVSLVNASQNIVTVIFIVAGAKMFGLLGIVIAPLAAVLLISMWYFPANFSRLLDLPKQEIKMMYKDAIYVLLLIAPLIGIFSTGSPGSWTSFAFDALAFTAVYILILCSISKSARKEAINLIGAIKGGMERVFNI